MGRTAPASGEARAEEASNSVVLVGRVCSAPVERELPSGARIATVRISVARATTPMTAGSRQRSDWVDCAAWAGRPRRSVLGWRVGDWVHLEGALRRRYYRVGSQPASRVEVEVLRARRVGRSAVP